MEPVIYGRAIYWRLQLLMLHREDNPHYRVIIARSYDSHGGTVNRARKIAVAVRRLILVGLCAAMFAASNKAWADTVNLGFLLLRSGSPGVSEFSINNFTGDAGLGGFALPADFLLLSFVTLKNAQLTIEESSGSELFPLSDLNAPFNCSFLALLATAA